jgi:SAM-dependent methyltransferase
VAAWGLADEYERQVRWRRWDEALSLVPLRHGERVLDLGCGVGDVTELFQRLGADVVGVDANEDLLGRARLRHPNVHFEKLDLNELTPVRFGRVDGIWASFVVAYFTDLDSVVERWRECLVPGGWLALVEVDDLLGHIPLPADLAEQVKAFYDESRKGGRYDFECGHRMADSMKRVGLRVVTERLLPDDELSFEGPALDEVLIAWRMRLDRMGGLKRFLGARFSEFERTFLATLASAHHRSNARIFAVVARNE